ncbi:MAG: R3H domain-containing nucleic acid-binding protein [Chloroflexota bacterium]
MTDNLEALIDKLPSRMAARLQAAPNLGTLLEVVMDLGRPAEARFTDGELMLGNDPVDQADLDQVVGRIGEFGDDNRAGIERTLHRISCIRNRKGAVVGLTCRVGRAVYGTTSIVRDVVESGESILLVGGPGVGKTTMLREMARVLADDLGKRVVIVDTSNEIAGDGDIPHPAIGRARRMQVRTPVSQHAVMIEAVENHMPEVIIIDEIGTELEAAAARTIAERGVQLVGTAHGNSLENLIANPTLSDLIGGIQTVTLGDEEARRRGTQKSVLERKGPPTFSVVMELVDWQRVAVHLDVASTVDAILRDFPQAPQLRYRDDAGEVHVETPAPRRQMRAIGGHAARASSERPWPADVAPWERDPIAFDRGQDAAGRAAESLDARGVLQPLKAFAFGVSRQRLEQSVRDMHLPVTLVDAIAEADVVITLKNYYRRKTPALREAEDAHIPIYVLKANSIPQMENCLANLFELEHDSAGAAVKEAENAADQVLAHTTPIELAPQNAYLRRLQHQVAEQHNLQSRSKGRDPNRRVKIFKPGWDASAEW